VVRRIWAGARGGGWRATCESKFCGTSFTSALANQGVPLFEIGAVLGHRTMATSARYAHHARERLVETATLAARAWQLLPRPVRASDATDA
jgi:integrase